MANEISNFLSSLIGVRQDWRSDWAERSKLDWKPDWVLGTLAPEGISWPAQTVMYTPAVRNRSGFGMSTRHAYGLWNVGVVDINVSGTSSFIVRRNGNNTDITIDSFSVREIIAG